MDVDLLQSVTEIFDISVYQYYVFNSVLWKRQNINVHIKQNDIDNQKKKIVKTSSENFEIP